MHVGYDIRKGDTVGFTGCARVTRPIGSRDQSARRIQRCTATWLAIFRIADYRKRNLLPTWGTIESIPGPLLTIVLEPPQLQYLCCSRRSICGIGHRFLSSSLRLMFLWRSSFPSGALACRAHLAALSTANLDCPRATRQPNELVSRPARRVTASASVYGFPLPCARPA